MSKSYKSAIGLNVLVVITIVVFVLGYVGLKLQIDFMKKELISYTDETVLLQNKNLDLLAQYQLLSSEERIRKIAFEELNLQNQSLPLFTLEVSGEEISRIEKSLLQKDE